MLSSGFHPHSRPAKNYRHKHDRRRRSEALKRPRSWLCNIKQTTGCFIDRVVEPMKFTICFRIVVIEIRAFFAVLSPCALVRFDRREDRIVLRRRGPRQDASASDARAVRALAQWRTEAILWYGFTLVAVMFEQTRKHVRAMQVRLATTQDQLDHLVGEQGPIDNVLSEVSEA
jgi:hypothetical protein